MLGLAFVILLAVFIIKAVFLAVRLTWGLLKILVRIVFFPAILVGLVVGGLIKLALPLIIIALIVIFMAK